MPEGLILGTTLRKSGRTNPTAGSISAKRLRVRFPETLISSLPSVKLFGRFILERLIETIRGTTLTSSTVQTFRRR
jgi:hypothetical protein